MSARPPRRTRRRPVASASAAAGGAGERRVDSVAALLAGLDRVGPTKREVVVGVARRPVADSYDDDLTEAISGIARLGRSEPTNDPGDPNAPTDDFWLS